MRLIQAWNETQTAQIMVERVESYMIENYGIADLGAMQSTPFTSIPIKGLIEKPNLEDAPSNLAVIGRYILPPTILNVLENTRAGVGGEIQLTDALDQLIKIEGINALETNAEIHDCGNKQGFLTANLAVGIRDPGTYKKVRNFFESKATDLR